MINLETFVLVTGLVSMIWRVVLKYHLLDKLVLLLKWPIEICVMCITFWVTLSVFLVIDHEISLFYNVLRAFSTVPFIIELTRKEWS